MIRAIGAAVAAFIVAAIVVLSGTDRDLLPGESTMSEMAGAWAGTAHIVVNWTNARTLPVRLTILPDGGVTGTVGDAVVRDARLQSNRTALGRALHIKTDWIVRGRLEGDIIRAEGIRRDAVMIPLNFVAGRFEGGVNTSGAKFGGKDSMVLAAGRLALDRVEVRQ